ncbi:MAG TPA: CAP domain-containing protein, partial [Solirubrobacteraceae bacterium]|nr:CAP domain-containing protein [Solirubrobacteraceae bacterium]
PPTCTETNITPTPANIEQVREVTLCLINRERAANGEQPLTVNRRLAQAAQGHSEDMINQDYFSHEAPGGSTPLERMEEAGYIYSSEIGYEVGENIAWGTLWLATPQSIVESWMQSPEHRANILDANYRETGMGVVAAAPPSRAEGQAGAIYTQDFGVIITG